MKIHTEKRVETTEIVELTFTLDEVKEALIWQNCLCEYGSPLWNFSEIEIRVSKYDAEICAPSVSIYAWKRIQNGEY